MIYDVSVVKSNKLKFDDIIRGQFMQGEYTHDIDGEKQFIMSRLLNDKWRVDNVFCCGFRSVIDTINSYDLKQFKLINK